MKSKHLRLVASPGNRFAICSQLQADEIVDWASRSMFTWNPFRIEERQRSRSDGDRQFGMEDVARSLRCVNIQGDRRLGLPRRKQAQMKNTATKTNL